MTPKRHLAPLAALVLPLAAVAGCGSSSGNDAHSSVPTASYSDPAAAQGAGAAGDLTKHTCTADAKGAWSFTGTLKNSTKQDSTYTITLSLTQKVGSTVVASHEVTKKVAGGATETVEAKDFATEKGSKQLACVVSTRAKRD